MKGRGIKEFLAGQFAILYNPKESFENLANLTLEKVIGNYVKMLLAVSIIAGILNIAFSVLQITYLKLFHTIDIHYLNVINYSFARSAGLVFIYLFAGTLIGFLIAAAISRFQKKYRLTELIKILIYSATPLVLLGWIPPSPLPPAIWAAILFAMGMKHYMPMQIKKDSIHNRD